MSEATSGISLLSALTKSEQAAIRAAALPGCDVADLRAARCDL